MRRRLSGIQPSGDLHLGNYFGAIKQHVALQENAFYFIADYHALTTIHNAGDLQRNRFEVAVAYLALGLDPDKATLFRQSDLPEVTELSWLLATVTGMGLLERAVAYKEKKELGVIPSVGLFTYPVLMAADILAYDTDVVPVGSDQVQHVEMARQMAGSFNALYGDTFRLPTYEVGVPVPVPGTNGKKMSKSYKNTIPIFATGPSLKSRVMEIQTSSAALADPKDPDTCPVFALWCLVASDTEREDMAERYRTGGYGYGHAKQALYLRLEDYFAAARARREDFVRAPKKVDDILRAGADRAAGIARIVTERARAACGLR